MDNPRSAAQGDGMQSLMRSRLMPAQRWAMEERAAEPSTEIEAAWSRYRDGVLPADAGQAQVFETKRAFYAGAMALWGAALASPRDLETIAALRLELDAFGRSGGRL